MGGCRCFQPMRAGGPGTLSLAHVPAQVRVQVLMGQAQYDAYVLVHYLGYR